MQHAKAVFLGVVDSIAGRSRTTRFRVTRWYKGGEADTVTVLTRRDPDGWWSTCDLLLRSGETWLIFAHPDSGGVPRTGRCTGSRTRVEADSTLQYLRLGWSPRP
jgi:hypothetical protein